MLDDMHAMRAPLPGPEAGLIGLAALGVVLIPLLWRLADHVDTLGVTLDREAGGVTSYRGYGRGPRHVLIACVGYLGPE